jgi:hypothetical protein
VREQLAFLVVALGVLAGFLYLLVEPSHWRRGTGVIAVALLIGAALRLVLRGYGAGLLAVRNRWSDTALYLLLGGLMLAVDIRLHS